MAAAGVVGAPAEFRRQRMEKEMAILPGTCHACKEPITRRQKSFTKSDRLR